MCFYIHSIFCFERLCAGLGRKFSLFDFTKEGKGVRKEDVPGEAPVGFSGFFQTLGSRFWNLTNLNLLYILCNFPLLIFLFALSGNTGEKVMSPNNSLFAPLFGMMSISDSSPLYNVYYGMLGGSTEIIIPTTLTYILYGLSALILLTFGLSNVGFSYVLRGYVRGEGVFLISDFFSAVKRNFKQGLIMGFVDIIFMVLFTYDLMFWGVQGQYLSSIFFYISLLLLLFYVFARFYMYLILITFDLPIKKILKNSFIFSLIGFKRNIIALLACVGVICFNYYILLVYMPIGVLLPFMITVAVCGFICAFAAYPNIKKIMIDPYEKKNPTPQSDVEPIFVDRG